jgi:3-hydroxyisobutyrate dehydrogenase-like beta-hydroxyacid dehydrogenase
MTPVIAIVASGAMGAGIARRLTEHGVKVVTVLTGRSAASRERATAAGMVAVSPEALVEADLLLSIVPPANALSFAEQTAFALKSGRRKPVFVDCNAVNPATVRHIQAVVAATGAEFVDGGIIGFPPVPGTSTGPRLYVSGEPAAKVEVLTQFGIDVRLLDGPVGAASALKMAYAGISKGHIAIMAAMVLAAERSGSTQALRDELNASEPHLMTTMARRVPGMFPKAYRWVAEMEEIAEFAREDTAARDLWTSIARLYERLAKDAAGDKTEIEALARFFKGS